MDILDPLWKRYRSKVEHARAYERAVGPVVNDHVAFRTVAWGPYGIHTVARPFEKLGWRAAGTYDFPDKKLTAIHYELAGRPKLFISELRAWELSPRARKILEKTMKAHGRFDFARCWPAPSKKDVLALDAESQYAAWVLLYGYEVNHFTASVKDVEKAAALLKEAGVPMKPEIEGARGSKLRQTSTQAVVLPVKVREGTIKWPYAYFELAERRGFEGFLGGQATNLFEMTKRRPKT